MLAKRCAVNAGTYAGVSNSGGTEVDGTGITSSKTPVGKVLSVIRIIATDMLT